MLKAVPVHIYSMPTHGSTDGEKGATESYAVWHWYWIWAAFSWPTL